MPPPTRCGFTSLGAMSRTTMYKNLTAPPFADWGAA